MNHEFESCSLPRFLNQESEILTVYSSLVAKSESGSEVRNGDGNWKLKVEWNGESGGDWELVHPKSWSVT